VRSRIAENRNTDLVSIFWGAKSDLAKVAREVNVFDRLSGGVTGGKVTDQADMDPQAIAAQGGERKILDFDDFDGVARGT
jgi:hypothetical protein